jgi:hypothetical protein
MKQWLRLTLVLCLASILMFLVLPRAAGAQEGQGKYVTEASVRLIRLVNAANRHGYKLHANTLSLGGGWLKKGTDTWVPLYTIKLEEGKQYRFIAAGDAEARDVDLEIQDADGKVVAHDDKTEPEAVVDFTPKTTGSYTVRIRLNDSMNSLPCFCVAIVMTKKG